MRKGLTLLMACLLLFALAACGGDKPDDKEPATGTPDTGGQAQKDTPVVDTPKEAWKADVGAYHVEIKGAKLAKDYEENPVIVVTYAWTNNSEETTSAMTAIMGKAFQGGIQLDSAIVGDSKVYDSGASMKEIRPGATLDVQSAFVLRDTTSPVEVEVGEWLTWDDKPAMAKITYDLATLS